MSILKLKPSCKDYLWGGSRLKEEYGKEYKGDVLAETWELSCHPDGPSFIDNGAYKGKTLQEYIDGEGKEVLGIHCRRFRCRRETCCLLSPARSMPLEKIF